MGGTPPPPACLRPVLARGGGAGAGRCSVEGVDCPEHLTMLCPVHPFCRREHELGTLLNLVLLSTVLGGIFVLRQLGLRTGQCDRMMVSEKALLRQVRVDFAREPLLGCLACETFSTLSGHPHMTHYPSCHVPRRSMACSRNIPASWKAVLSPQRLQLPAASSRNWRAGYRHWTVSAPACWRKWLQLRRPSGVRRPTCRPSRHRAAAWSTSMTGGVAAGLCV